MCVCVSDKKNFLRAILRETCSLCRNLSILYSYFKLVDFSSPLPVVFPDLGFPRNLECSLFSCSYNLLLSFFFMVNKILTSGIRASVLDFVLNNGISQV